MTAGLADALLADRYRLLEQIAVGGMGEVWRAQDVLLGRVVAVKTLRPEHLGDADFRARFRAEAKHAGGLTHPGIASVFDFGEDDSRAFLVMELVEGEPLSTLLRREGALSADRVLDLVAQTADALHAAHVGGVVHRDVKPGNLLVRPDGVLKVTDFGIASAVDAVPLTQTGLVVGTAYYLSPEQAAGRSGSPASDIYGLGVVAYECLAGGRPFRGDNPIAVALAHLREQPPPLPSEVPPQVRDLVVRAMAKEPEQRFADAAAMAGAARSLRAQLLDGTLRAEPGTASDDGGLAALPVEPPAGVEAPTGLLELPEQDRRGPRHAPGSRSRSARSAVRLVLGLLVVLAVGLGLRTMLTPPADARTTVPEVAVGTDAVEAVQLLRDADLEVERRSRTSPDVAAGTVLRLVPTAGTALEPGSSVELWLSAGPETAVVEAGAYAGLPAVEVQEALTGLGLVPRLAYDGSGTPVGTVSGVDPVGALPLGSEVVLHVVPEPPAPAPVAVAPEPVAPPAPAAPEPDPAPRPEPEPEPEPAPGSERGRDQADPPGQGRGRGSA